jgi:hypothetical protein
VDYDGVRSGDLVNKINAALVKSDWLVLVMTPAALRSQWVTGEVNAALHRVNSKRMKGVIPFVMKKCRESDIPPLWAALHRYDATGDYHLARDGLLQALGLIEPLPQDTDDLPDPFGRTLTNDSWLGRPAFSTVCTWCVHWEPAIRVHVCKAFPKTTMGIPDEIWDGKNLHMEPYGPQPNNITFAPAPEATAIPPELLAAYEQARNKRGA